MRTVAFLTLFTSGAGFGVSRGRGLSGAESSRSSSSSESSDDRIGRVSYLGDGDRFGVIGTSSKEMRLSFASILYLTGYRITEDLQIVSTEEQ